MRRDRLPYLVAAALLLGAAVGAALVAAAGWRGEVRYTAIPTVSLPLAAAPPEEAPGRPAVERLGGLDAPPPPPPPPPAGAAAGQGPPMVALVIAGLGLARDRSETALRLPAPVGLAVSPYADDPGGWLGRVGAAGHEAMLMLPLAAGDPALADAGPQALRPGQAGAGLEAALDRVLGRGSTGPAGVVTEAGAFAREGGAAFAPVAEALAKRRLGLVELDGEHLAAVAARRGLAYASAGRAVDEAPGAAAVGIALGGLEARALRQGAAVGWARGYPATFESLAAWAASLPGKGLRLVPVGTVLAPPAGGPPSRAAEAAR